MAGEPAPPGAIQAAILKSNAGMQAAGAPSGTITPGGAVARDLSIMAQEGAQYSEGVAKGNSYVEQNRRAQAARLAEEKRQADAQRAAEAAARDARAQAQLAAIEQARISDQARLAQASIDALENQKALQAEEDNEARAEAARRVKFDAATKYGPKFLDMFETVIGGSTSPAEAMEIFDNYKRYKPDSELNRDILQKYVDAHYQASTFGTVAPSELPGGASRTVSGPGRVITGPGAASVVSPTGRSQPQNNGSRRGDPRRGGAAAYQPAGSRRLIPEWGD